MTFDEWLATGRQIAKISSASTWWLGDWLVYGERAYGRRYRAALELTCLDYTTLRNYASVARRVQMSRRRDSLSFQHHAEVAALPEAEQDLWLRRAETFRWSRNELRRRLGERRRAELGEAGRSVVLRIEVGADRERLWRQAAVNAQQELADWLATIADDAATESVLGLPTGHGDRPTGQWDNGRGTTGVRPVPAHIRRAGASA